jgi:hypothetical protein
LPLILARHVILTSRMIRHHFLNLYKQDYFQWLVNSMSYAQNALILRKTGFGLLTMYYNTFCGGVYVYLQLVAISILGCRQMSGSTNFSCAPVLGLLTKFATIGCVSSLQVYSLIAPLCQYILSMAGHTLANALKSSCSHGVGLDFMCTLCVINLLDN